MEKDILKPIHENVSGNVPRNVFRDRVIIHKDGIKEEKK